MGTERQPAVATGGTLKSEQDLHDSIHATDPRHNVFGLAASLLRLVSQAQWPDGTPMQAHCVMHECAAKLMPLPCQQQQQQQQWNSQATGGAECVLPMLPASEVLLGLGARGFPGCIVATQSAYELLSGTVKFVPWLRSPELPMHPQDVKAGSTASGMSTASGGVGAVPAAGSSMVCMGGGPQHLTQAQLYVADAPGLACAAALSHAEALRAQAAEQQQQQQQQHAHAQLLQPQPQQQQQQQQQQGQQHVHAQRQQQQQQLQQPQQWQQMDVQQQKALQRVQQQRIKVCATGILFFACA
ncbi:hypothetical protein DUNSADRAFT_1690 [Dunaliella salina]|uniref:Uncharacterized protein n=1 Tax=Dunaliella salina TaxID=3046 RepID=A0ABQ7GWT7_DUNSA|nr:hypothetical protein DUNSADRAFT_1690 [Dunaliella salina]|eukprot:KAF5839073.1 hypothetical protein DUNSADRAFT_1690 [Dunaliella salina]